MSGVAGQPEVETAGRADVLVGCLSRFTAAVRAEVSFRLRGYAMAAAWYEEKVPEDEKRRLEYRHSQARRTLYLQTRDGDLLRDPDPTLIKALLEPRPVVDGQWWEAEPRQWLMIGYFGSPISEDRAAHTLLGLAAHPATSDEVLLRLVSLTEPVSDVHKPPNDYWTRWCRDYALAELASRWVAGGWTPGHKQLLSLLDMRTDGREFGSVLLADPRVQVPTLLEAASQGVRPSALLTIAGPVPTLLAKSKARAAVLSAPDEWPPETRVRVGAAVGGRELEEAGVSMDPWLRLGVAANPRADHLVNALTHDPDPDVRDRARTRQDGHTGTSPRS